MDEKNTMHESQAQHDGAEQQVQDSALTTCQTERDAWKEKYLRVAADLENFSKRTDKERIQWRNAAQTALLLDILPIIDDFDRAFAATQVDQDAQSVLTGFDMIRKSLYKFLDKHEVKEIDGTLPFDPEFHEALLHVDAPEKASGEIVAVLQKGFTFKGAVLRPAKVSVAK